MNNNNLNFIFWGTPDAALETLETLKEKGFVPSLIVTSPDAKKGRGLRTQASPVALFAEQNKIPCLKPEKLDEKEIENVLRTIGSRKCAGSTFLNGDGQRTFSAENFRGEQNIPDFLLVVAYGKIIPENILKIPKLGSINIHYSLLPKYRGASPVESAILNGDIETGVTIQQMEYKMDSGPIIAQEKVVILPDEKAPDLRKRLVKIGSELLLKILQIPSTSDHSPFIEGEKQDESRATYCKKIEKEDGLIDLNDDAVMNYNKFRAYALWPRTFFFKEGKRVIITDAELKNGKFVIKKIIPEGKREIKYEEI